MLRTRLRRRILSWTAVAFCAASVVVALLPLGCILFYVLKQGASVGANATLLCGITVGRYAMIGAGAVVTRDVPDYGLALGNPARVAGHVCRCGTRLETKPASEMSCAACGARYTIKGEGIVPRS